MSAICLSLLDIVNMCMHHDHRTQQSHVLSRLCKMHFLHRLCSQLCRVLLLTLPMCVRGREREREREGGRGREREGERERGSEEGGREGVRE